MGNLFDRLKDLLSGKRMRLDDLPRPDDEPCQEATHHSVVDDQYKGVAFELIDEAGSDVPEGEPVAEGGAADKEWPQQTERVDRLLASDAHPEAGASPEPKQDAATYGNLSAYDPVPDLRDYIYPGTDLLEVHGWESNDYDAVELEASRNQIINTLSNYGISIRKITATAGPTVTLYEMTPATGMPVSRIKRMQQDILYDLRTQGTRLLIPIPGKVAIGIEIPNRGRRVLGLRVVLGSEAFRRSKALLPLALGVASDARSEVVDLAELRHLLIGGSTRQGKSNFLHALLLSLLFKKHPAELKLVLVDPKRLELSGYRAIERHFLARLPGMEEAVLSDVRHIVSTLNALCIEVDNRYDLLKEAGVRNIREYNDKFIQRSLNPQKGHQYLPFLVLVIDSYESINDADPLALHTAIGRLVHLGPTVGLHLILVTTRPVEKVIPVQTRNEMPGRAAFHLPSELDSRLLLETHGAELLSGDGDLLFYNDGQVQRVQAPLVESGELERVNDFIAGQKGYPKAFLLPEYVNGSETDTEFDWAERDPLFEEAARLIVQNQLGSTSLLQRRLKLGYNRAGRLMDQLGRAGIVGPNLGAKAREVLFRSETELMEHLSMLG